MQRWQYDESNAKSDNGQTIDITGSSERDEVTVHGSPLVIFFHLLFLRPSEASREGDIMIEEHDSVEIAHLKWEIINQGIIFIFDLHVENVLDNLSSSVWVVCESELVINTSQCYKFEWKMLYLAVALHLSILTLLVYSVFEWVKSHQGILIPYLSSIATFRPEHLKMSRFGKTFVKLLHILCRKIFRPFNFCFDERILELIFQNLSLIDQVCLSLTCKKFFGLFGTIAKHQDFQFPRLLRIRNPILCVNSTTINVPRNELLLRLENRRWAYCANCLKLHPRKEFARHLLRKSALERSCTYYAGIVDLCPCISLTIRDQD